LRGELSAVDTYDKVIEKFATDTKVFELIRIREEHMQSADRLQDNIRHMGGYPDHNAGVWGTFAHAIQTAANLFGEGSAVCTLRVIASLEHKVVLRDAYGRSIPNVAMATL
jgi:hypothetical protein